MAMSHARFQSKMLGMTSVAQAVYEAVPLAEGWDTSRITRELADRYGKNIDHRVVGGCLAALRDAGLIKEIGKDYKREPVRAVIVKNTSQETTESTDMESQALTTLAAKAKAKSLSPMDRLEQLAQRVVDMQVRHAAELKELSDAISDAAVDIQAQLDADHEDAKRFRQAQALFAPRAA